MNIFEQAAKLKIRFSYKGFMLTEDLYDLSLDELNNLYIRINKVLKEQSEEGLLTVTTNGKNTEILQLQVDLIKHIFKNKEDAAKAAYDEKIRKEKKHRIMEIISNKKEQELFDKPVEDLMKMLDDL